MIMPDYSEPLRSYKSYKNEQFNKKLEKMRQLINAVNETSLKADDKIKLKKQMQELFN